MSCARCASYVTGAGGRGGVCVRGGRGSAAVCLHCHMLFLGTPYIRSRGNLHAGAVALPPNSLTPSLLSGALFCVLSPPPPLLLSFIFSLLLFSLAFERLCAAPLQCSPPPSLRLSFVFLCVRVCVGVGVGVGALTTPAFHRAAVALRSAGIPLLCICSGALDV